MIQSTVVRSSFFFLGKTGNGFRDFNLRVQIFFLCLNTVTTPLQAMLSSLQAPTLTCGRMFISFPQRKPSTRLSCLGGLTRREPVTRKPCQTTDQSVILEKGRELLTKFGSRNEEQNQHLLLVTLLVIYQTIFYALSFNLLLIIPFPFVDSAEENGTRTELKAKLANHIAEAGFRLILVIPSCWLIIFNTYHRWVLGNCERLVEPWCNVKDMIKSNQ